MCDDHHLMVITPCTMAQGPECCGRSALSLSPIPALVNLVRSCHWPLPISHLQQPAVPIVDHHADRSSSKQCVCGQHRIPAWCPYHQRLRCPWRGDRACSAAVGQCTSAVSVLRVLLSRSAGCLDTHVYLVQGVDRRAALGLIAAAVAAARVAPAEAAYGDAARVFAGKVTNKSGTMLMADHLAAAAPCTFRLCPLRR